MTAQISLSYRNPLKSRFGEAFLKSVPASPGVYFFLDEGGDPLYIGKSDCLRKRVRGYASAKPGRVAEHTLEMLELASRVEWELHATGAQALAREAELIRLMRPPFNIAGIEAVPYVYVGVKPGRPRGACARWVDFRVSRAPLGAGFATYGCFRRRREAKAGYTALLRLFFASSRADERFH